MAVIHLATAQRNGMCNQATTFLDAGSGDGLIKLYTGTQPVNANTALSGNTLLATFTLSKPSFGTPSAGVATLQGTPIATTGVAAGTATFFRASDSTGTAICFDGTVTATGGGGALELNTTTISNGVAVSITSGSFTMPDGT
jgi:hypothetical protein